MGSLTKRLHHRLKQEAKRKEAQNIVNEQWNEQCRKADISILYTLHTEFGFGAKRIRKFYKAMIKNHFRMCDSFQCNGDDSHYDVMASRLKYAGIDIQALQAEADEIEKELNGR